jgi:hypothetical protein
MQRWVTFDRFRAAARRRLYPRKRTSGPLAFMSTRPRNYLLRLQHLAFPYARTLNFTDSSALSAAGAEPDARRVVLRAPNAKRTSRLGSVSAGYLHMSAGGDVQRCRRMAPGLWSEQLRWRLERIPRGSDHGDRGDRLGAPRAPSADCEVSASCRTKTRTAELRLRTRWRPGPWSGNRPSHLSTQ